MSASIAKHGIAPKDFQRKKKTFPRRPGKCHVRRHKNTSKKEGCNEK